MFTPVRSFRVSPDKHQSRDWINVKLYSSLDRIKVMQGGAEYLDNIIEKMRGKKNITPTGDTIVGFFEAPPENFKPNTKKGRCAGTIVMIDDPGINVIAHEATHAAHCYTSAAYLALQKSKRLTHDEEHEWYHEAIATVVESIVSQITKKLGYRNSIMSVHPKTKKIVRPE